MNTTYRGNGVDLERRQRKLARTRRRRDKLMLTRVNAVILAGCVAAVLLSGGYALKTSARAAKADDCMNETQAYTETLNNRINSIRFEIERETNPEYLVFKAETNLGMTAATTK